MVFFWLPGCKFSFKGSLSHNSAKHLFLTTVQLRTANFGEPTLQKPLISQRHCCSANPKIWLGFGPFSNSRVSFPQPLSQMPVLRKCSCASPSGDWHLSQDPASTVPSALYSHEQPLGMVFILNRLIFTGHFWQPSAGPEMPNALAFLSAVALSVLKLVSVTSVAICAPMPTRSKASNVCCFDTRRSSPGTRSFILTSARMTGHVIPSGFPGGGGGPTGGSVGG